MSTTSYKKNAWTVRIVIYQYRADGVLKLGQRVSYAKTDEEAEKETRETFPLNSFLDFFVWRTISKHY